MRQAFAHDAVLVLASEADIRAPGAAVTVALCGSWDHEPPCPLAPHHSEATRADGEVHLRILFAADPEDEGAVRHRIDTALAGGHLRGPDGATSRWQLRATRHSKVAPEEADHAERLIHA
ncbi:MULTISPECIES: hypothetical protein [Protofrankia]|nr:MULTISPECIES: hypothetical protein [Protofrankia]ONH37580.1 hypothetical protein BL254_03130 [Protofrankia sp. BMG5.30]